MQKINFIGLLIILTTGCSVFKSNAGKENRYSNGIIDEKYLESVEKQNITANGFYIQKADIEIKTQEGSEKLLGSVKFENPDKYLISIKSRTGIEIIRVFITKDTVLINDRINKKMYFGSTGHISVKYGISVSELPLILGDFVSDMAPTIIKANCIDGRMGIDTYLKGTKINYVIDCRKGKPQKTSIINSLSNAGVDILYSDYLKHSSGITPGIIQMIDLQRKINVKIRIRKIETPWTGKADFIPGKQYEILQLP